MKLMRANTENTAKWRRSFFTLTSCPQIGGELNFGVIATLLVLLWLAGRFGMDRYSSVIENVLIAFGIVMVSWSLWDGSLFKCH